MVGRRGRGGSRAARFATRRSTTPAIKHDDFDEEMADGDGNAEEDDTRDPTPQDEDNEDAATPAQDTEAQDDDDNDASSPPVIQSIPRRRGRPGRPRLSRPDVGTPDPNGDDNSESGTPQRRRRGRPSGSGFRGGFRGRPRHQPAAQVTRVPIDKEGNMMDVVNDEVALPEDDEGETKVDKDGQLQGGRDYRVRVFTIQGRGERLYMLSTEPARCTGFRDSYLFFTKHLTLFKIIVDDAEKRDLIARDIIPHSYKGRSIGVVTARSVFREFGARIVIGGKRITDDYQVQAARERGNVEGELADPHDRLPAAGETYNKNQYVAWHGASQVYHNNAPSVPLPSGKPVTGKRKMNVTAVNWQFEHAREASRFNTTLSALRRANLDGVYDPHTNLMFYPRTMQPTHVKWEQLPTPSDHLITQQRQQVLTNDLTTSSQDDDGPHPEPSETIFPPLPRTIARNFLVTDTVFTAPALPHLGIPGPDGAVSDLGPNGLSSVSKAVLDELPEACREAFEQVRDAELQWKRGWGSEQVDGSRGTLRIGFNGFPV